MLAATGQHIEKLLICLKSGLRERSEWFLLQVGNGRRGACPASFAHFRSHASWLVWRSDCDWRDGCQAIFGASKHFDNGTVGRGRRPANSHVPSRGVASMPTRPRGHGCTPGTPIWIRVFFELRPLTVRRPFRKYSTPSPAILRIRK